MTTHYITLGVHTTATSAEIKVAYRKLAMEYHPDRNKSPGAEDKFKSINEAYDILSNESSRKVYDAKISNPYANSWNNSAKKPRSYDSDDDLDFSDLFENFRKQSRARSQSQNSQSQSIHKHILKVSLKEAYTGTRATVGVYPGFTVIIPPGAASGSKYYYGANVVELVVVPDNKFKRSENDLLVEVGITMPESILGLCATITHVDGKLLQFNIPAGIQPGQVIRLSGKGMPSTENSGCGDLLIRCNISIPTNFTIEQKKFFESLNARKSINI